MQDVDAPRGDDDAADDDGAAIDELTELNTRQNVYIPPEYDTGGRPSVHPGAKRPRRFVPALSVRFDPQPPSVRLYEPPSPEPISDPEAAHGLDPTPLPQGALAPPPPKRVIGPSKPTCEVSISSASRLKAVENVSLGGGRFSNLVSVEVGATQAPATSAHHSPSPTDGARRPGSGGDVQVCSASVCHTSYTLASRRVAPHPPHPPPKHNAALSIISMLWPACRNFFQSCTPRRHLLKAQHAPFPKNGAVPELASGNRHHGWGG